MIDQTNTYQIVDNVLFQKVDDETVILEPENGNYFTLDAIGTLMIESLQKGKNVLQVIQSITAEYDVDTEQVTADLTELLNNMLEQNLMVQTH